MLHFDLADQYVFPKTVVQARGEARVTGIVAAMMVEQPPTIPVTPVAYHGERGCLLDALLHRPRQVQVALTLVVMELPPDEAHRPDLDRLLTPDEGVIQRGQPQTEERTDHEAVDAAE